MILPKAIIVDTNVLIHDPESIEVLMNDVNILFLHTIVLQELDNLKTQRDIGRDCREAIRKIEQLHKDNNPRLKIVQHSNWDSDKASHLNKSKNDHHIIVLALNLLESNEYKGVKLISKDTAVRILARDVGLVAEDYLDVSIKIDNTNLKEVKAPCDIIEKRGAGYVFKSDEVECIENEGVVCWSDWNGELDPHNNTEWRQNFTAIKKGKYFRIVDNSISMMGVSPYSMNAKLRNWEQYVAMQQLMDDDIKCSFMIGGAGSGKAQPLDAKVLTPQGWVDMGEILPGDEILTPQGDKTTVLSIHPQGKIDTYKVIFSDGSSTECSDDHLWYTRTCYDKKMGYDGSAKTLKQIRDTLYVRNGRRNHTIPMVSNISFNKVDVPIDPYLLGVILGDGCISGYSTPSISTIDDEIINNINAILLSKGMILGKKVGGCTYYINHINKPSWNEGGNIIRNLLTSLGLTGRKSETKFIPDIYKYNSIDVRISVIQGLLDTDGTIGKTNNISYTTSSYKLMMDVRDIVMSLGGKAVVKSRYPKYTYNGESRVGKLSYTLFISLPNGINPFRLSRKMRRVKDKIKYPPMRLIDRIEYVGKKECQCIYVDSPRHLYVTDDYIVTHNTMLALAAAMEQRSKFRNILITRPMVHLEDEDRMGFLPGSVEDKMSPWLRPIYRTISQIGAINTENAKIIQKIRENNKIEIESLDYVRGMTFFKDILIVDEAQNLTPHQIKTIITRVGERSKIIFTGDLGQIDRMKKIDSHSSGLAYASTRLAGEKMVSTVHFKKTVRSELAERAERLL